MGINFGSGFISPWMNSKEKKAIALIEEWLEKSDRQVYCSVSGGKDSLVAGHLVRQVFPECPMVWVNQGRLAEWPDCVELLEYLRSDRHWNLIELCPPVDLLGLYREYGVPLEGTMDTKIDKQINWRLIYSPLQEFEESHGIKGFAWGLRKSESRNRAFYLKKYGGNHLDKKGRWICSPVGFWTTENIWSYIDMHKLPYPAMYDIGRTTVRNGPPIGTTGANWGRLAMLRRHFPEFYAKFVKEFPEVANYG